MSGRIDWHIVSNDGTNLVAYNMVTKQLFEGTTEDFNALISQSIPPSPELVIPVTTSGTLISNLPFNLPSYDKIDLSYSGNDITSVIYYSNSVIVAVLSLTYAGGKISTVTRVV